MLIRPFDPAIPEDALRDLFDRVRTTRWPARADDGRWGIATERVRRLAARWVEAPRPDVRSQGFEHLLAGAPEEQVHVVQRGRSGQAILLLHGWPGSYLQMLDLADLLASGPDPLTAVVASLPGFAWSAPMLPAPTLGAAADRLHEVMRTLGHARYAVHGTDFGAGVAAWLTARYPEAVLALHTGGTSPRADGITEDDPEPLRRYAAEVRTWRSTEVGYAQLQSTKPDTLAVALTDSPVGLLAWLAEKLDRWSAGALADDQILTDVTLYWVTRSIGSSMRWYTDPTPDPDLRDSPVPIAWLMPEDDMLPTPREWVERTNRIDRWTQVPHGGHFPEWTRPDLVADDIRAFLRGLR